MSSGRNDPCPCGSGKKHKRCCLVAPLDLMEQAARRVREAQARAEPRVSRFLASLCVQATLERAWEEFSCGFADLKPDGPEIQLFQPWLLYDWVPMIPGSATESGSLSVAQRYLEEHGARLSPDERSFLETTSKTPLSFHDVLDVEPGRRMRLRDVLNGAEHEVFERSGSEILRAGDIVYARVVLFDAVALMIGSGATPLPPIEKKPLIELRERMRRLGRLAPERSGTDSRVLRRLYLEIRDRLLHPAPPILNNTDDEPIEFHTITCDVESAESAFNALASLAKGHTREELLQSATLDRRGRLQKVEFPWLKRGNRKHSSWDNTVLGHIVLEGTNLKADVNSAGRSRRLQKEIRKRLGTTARNLTVVVKPLAESFSDYEKVRDTPEERAGRMEDEKLRSSPEIQEAMQRIEERQWEAWLEEQIPALDGQTPLKAVRTPAGREMVEALLLQFERHDRGAGKRGYDFGRLRRKLGLPVREA